MKELKLFWDALAFALVNHKSQSRKSKNIPYIIHPLRILTILRSVGFSEIKDNELMISALFHDLIEDTDVKKKDIVILFGDKIASIVKELSKPKNQTKEIYLKSFKNASKKAKIIKMGDRIDNLLDMNISYWSDERKKKYAKEAKIILKHCGQANHQLSLYLNRVINEILSS
ncbi:MAG: HD domain-containing protein [Candidatus Lokiarchaeota archaeon]|nr:HD domain-containing protein [Candidatus Lokiarchaeota archaeon]